MPRTDLRKELPVQLHPIVDWSEHARMFLSVLPDFPGRASIDLLEAARTLVRDRPDLAAHVLALLTIPCGIARMVFGSEIAYVACGQPGCTSCGEGGMSAVPLPPSSSPPSSPPTPPAQPPPQPRPAAERWGRAAGSILFFGGLIVAAIGCAWCLVEVCRLFTE